MNARKYLENLNGNLNIDISAHSLYDIETGTRTVIDYELAAIAKILKTSSDSLMKEFYDFIDNI